MRVVPITPFCRWSTLGWALVAFGLAGCLNTPVLRDGRVLDAGRRQGEVRAGLNWTPRPIATGRDRLVGETVSEAKLEDPTPFPTFGIGLRAGVGDGVELAISAHLVPIALGGGLDLGLRWRIHEAAGFAAAMAFSVGGAFVLGDQCRSLEGDQTCDDGSVLLTGVLARAGVDLSHHWGAFAVYASPSIGYIERSRTDFATVEGVDYEAEAEAATLLVGSSVGVAIGRRWGLNLEMGAYLTPSGHVLWVPAIGYRMD